LLRFMVFQKIFDQEDVFGALTDKLATAAVVAKRTGCSIFTVKRLLKELYKSGRIECVEIELPNGINYVWRK
jgi:transcription initiation factor IIE alpha subunit